VNTPNVTFDFDSNEPNVTYECRLDGGAWEPCADPTTEMLPDGNYTLEVRAKDAAGNVDGSPASRSFTVDATAPDTAVDSGASGRTSDPTPTFEFSSPEAGAEFECRFDSAAFAACSGPGATHTPASSLADGQHTFQVRAKDALGNVDGTPATRTFTVDTVVPNTAVDAGPEGPVNDATPTFAFSSPEAGV
jgi:hypothetical protein